MAVFTATTDDGRPLFGVAHTLEYRDFPEKTSFPWLLELFVYFKKSEANGLPTRSELKTINAFQDQLLAALAGVTNLHYVGHVTGNDARILFCYLPEPSSPNAFLTVLTNRPSKREFQYSITEDPSWDLAKKLGI
jgi:hypothetical protein